jgi:hypothetical protein
MLVQANIPRIEPDAPEELDTPEDIDTPEELETLTEKWVDCDPPCI